jgi:hypothetical protein
MQAFLFIILRVGYELGLVWWLWIAWRLWSDRVRRLVKAQPHGQPRQRHPPSPRDCPVCRAAHGTREFHEQRVVGPWAKQKSKRGRPKVIATDGYGCPNPHAVPQCRYFKITDARVHALVGDGLHYGADTIQYLRCQACHTKFSVRVGTVMYDLKTPAGRVDEVMTATSEGVDVAAASRIFKHDERTIQRWLTRTGLCAQRLHHHFSLTWRVIICNWMNWSPSFAD